MLKAKEMKWTEGSDLKKGAQEKQHNKNSSLLFGLSTLQKEGKIVQEMNIHRIPGTLYLNFFSF